MHVRTIATPLFLAVILLQTSCTTLFSPHTYEESEDNKGRTGLLLRPAKDAPQEQLDYANRLKASAQYRKARKQYRALYSQWPSSPQAGWARLEYAGLLRRKGNLRKAADEYTQLLNQNSGSVPHERVLTEMYDLAMELMKTRSGKLLIFKGFKSPEKAIPILESIVKHGPRWSRAAEALFRKGRIQQEIFRYEEAIRDYNQLIFLYTSSDWAEEAAFYKGECLTKLSDERPNNGESADKAWTALSLFISDYPDSEHYDEGFAYRAGVGVRRARMAFKRAEFYDRIVHKPKAALREYRTFVRTFPNSEWTKQAELRIEELRSEN